jgi:hypothetical protein
VCRARPPRPPAKAAAGGAGDSMARREALAHAPARGAAARARACAPDQQLPGAAAPPPRGDLNEVGADGGHRGGCRQGRHRVGRGAPAAAARRRAVQVSRGRGGGRWDGGGGRERAGAARRRRARPRRPNPPHLAARAAPASCRRPAVRGPRAACCPRQACGAGNLVPCAQRGHRPRPAPSPPLPTSGPMTSASGARVPPPLKQPQQLHRMARRPRASPPGALTGVRHGGRAVGRGAARRSARPALGGSPPPQSATRLCPRNALGPHSALDAPQLGREGGAPQWGACSPRRRWWRPPSRLPMPPGPAPRRWRRGRMAG